MESLEGTRNGALHAILRFGRISCYWVFEVAAGLHELGEVTKKHVDTEEDGFFLPRDSP